MIGMEVVQHKETKQHFPPKVTKDGKNIKEVITGECYKRGLILYGAGYNSIRISPPLVISKGEVDFALKIIEEAVNFVESQL